MGSKNEIVVPEAQRIRPIAIGVVWKEGRLLVSHGFDSIRSTAFYRPPGGAIEFGETASAAVKREFLEEMDAALSEPRLIAVLENIFEFEAKRHHEIVFVLESEFEDRSLYDREQFVIREPPVNTVASWKSIEELALSEVPLYPQGLPELLNAAR